MDTSPDPSAWVTMVERFGVSTVLLVATLWVGYKHFLLPMRQRELKFVDDVSDTLNRDRETTREALQTICSGIVAIEGYAKSLSDTQRDISSELRDLSKNQGNQRPER